MRDEIRKRLFYDDVKHIIWMDAQYGKRLVAESEAEMRKRALPHPRSRGF